MHAEADRTERHLVPEVVAQLLERHDENSRALRDVWRVHRAGARAYAAAYQRIAAHSTPEHGVDLDAGLRL